MWQYEKKLQYPVRIKNTNPALAKVIISQLGGPDGELGAAMRYLSQRYSAPCREVQAILSDIGASLYPRRKSCPQHEPQAAVFLGNTAQPLCVRRAVRFFVRLPKFDAALLAQGKENLGNMTENMQADDV